MKVSFCAVLILTKGPTCHLVSRLLLFFSDESVLRGTGSLVPDQDPDSASVETEGDAVNHDLNTFDA